MHQITHIKTETARRKLLTEVVKDKKRKRYAQKQAKELFYIFFWFCLCGFLGEKESVIKVGYVNIYIHKRYSSKILAIR